MNILLDILYYIIPFVILLGILVFVHEFGHFIIARLLKVKVTAFSIGFGKELWSCTDKKGTRWKISAIPLGGYCQFLGDADASSSTVDSQLKDLSEEDKKGAFPLQPAWKKIAIVIAGPLFNYLFAILIFSGLFYAFGKVNYPSVIGEVMPGEAADLAGLRAEDKIVSLNGNPITDFQSLINEVALAETDDIVLQIERPVQVTLQAQEMSFASCGNQHPEKIIGVASLPTNSENGVEVEPPAVVGNLVPDSPAQKSGLLQGDVLQSINGQPLLKFQDLKNYVSEHIDDTFNISALRKLTINVTLKDSDYTDETGKHTKRRMLGVKSKPQLSFSEQMSFTEAVVAGVKESYDLTVVTLRGVGQMLTGKRGGEDVGGIIRIAEMSGDISKTGGLLSFIYFMALLSVNLGLINLLPIPVLDGGSLVIFIFEMIIGKELKANVKEYIFRFGLFIILAIMVLATWNDIVHLINRWFD